MNSDRFQTRRLSGSRRHLNLINASIEVRGDKDVSLGRFDLISCDVNEEMIARCAWFGFYHANGRQGTAEETFRFIAENFSVYESKIAGSMEFRLDIDANVWAEAGETFTANHFKNGETNHAPLSLILRFLREPAADEPELDAALRRVLTDAVKAQFPNLANAFGIGTGTITLDRAEQELLRQTAELGSLRRLSDNGIETVDGVPIDELMMKTMAAISRALPRGLTADQIVSRIEKIDRLLPFDE